MADQDTSSGVGRRRWLGLAVAGLAAAAGAGAAWWRLLPAAGSGQADDAAGALWGLQFDQPGGGQLDMAGFRGRPVLLNFWATWCPPCVDELPLLDRYVRDQAGHGLQVIGLAIDQPSSVAKFLQKMPLAYPVGLAGLTGTELGRSLGNTEGALPFTVVIDADGRIIQRKMGRITAQELASWSRPG